MDRLKILVADDNVIYRKIISNAVESTGLGSVEHTASNTEIALEWLKQCEIDIVLVDTFMVSRSNYKTIKQIKDEFPAVDIIVVSREGHENAAVTLEALKQGAIDFILKPSDTDNVKEYDKFKGQLKILLAQEHVKRYSEGRVSISAADVTKDAPSNKKEEAAGFSGNERRKPFMEAVDLVVIASSTGGPVALETIFSQIPSGFIKPILVVQHMPAEFTNVLAQTLDKKSVLTVAEGRDGELVRPGKAIIAPGGVHMLVEKTGINDMTIRLELASFVNGVRPSADVLFDSVASAYEGKAVLAVVLTGMGNDGTKGIGALKKKCRCYCITQSESSCVVYGMPRCVFEEGLSDETADLKDIAKRMYQITAMRS